MREQDYRTEEEVVEEDVVVWAVPIKSYEEGYGERTFKYRMEIRNDSPYEEGATAVVGARVKVTVPAGINLVEKAVATLRRKKEEADAEYEKEVAERLERKLQKKKRLDDQIAALSLLTHVSEEAQEGTVIENGE